MIGLAEAGARRRVSEWASQVFLAVQRLARTAARERKARRRSIPILNFHRVSDHRPEHWMTIEPDVFENLLQRLKARYRMVSLSDVDEILTSGDNAEDLLAITFDDSYGCNYRCAVPLLKALEVPATFFIASGFVDRNESFPHDAARGFHDLPNFTTAQIAAMSQDPLFEIGSHTVSHVDFSRALAADALNYELQASKRDLERMTTQPVTRFAVPFGGLSHCSPRVMAAAAECGYRRVYSHFGGRNAVSADGHVGYVLNRICELGSPRFLVAMLEGYQGWKTTARMPRVSAPGDPFHPAVVRLPL